MDSKRLYMLLRLFGLIIFLILLYFGLKYALLLLYPFIIAFCLSLLLVPFVSFLQTRWKVPRVLATLIMMAISFIALSGSILFVITELIQGTTFLADKVPKHFQAFAYLLNKLITDHVLPYYDKMTSFLNTLHPAQQDIIYNYIEQLMSKIGTTGAHFIQKVLLIVPQLVTLLPQSMTISVFIVLATFFITKDMPVIRERLRAIVPKVARSSSLNVFGEFRKLVFSYFKAQLIVISITAILILFGLIIIQIEHAITIALFAAIVDLLPFVGTGVIFIPWLIYLFLTGNYLLTIKLTILYMIIIIVRQTIEPKILSDHIGVRPLVTLVVMFAGFQIWGIIGIVFAPFLLVLYNALKRAGVFEQLHTFIKGS